MWPSRCAAQRHAPRAAAALSPHATPAVDLVWPLRGGRLGVRADCPLSVVGAAPKASWRAALRDGLQLSARVAAATSLCSLRQSPRLPRAAGCAAPPLWRAATRSAPCSVPLVRCFQFRFHAAPVRLETRATHAQVALLCGTGAGARCLAAATAAACAASSRGAATPGLCCRLADAGSATAPAQQPPRRAKSWDADGTFLVRSAARCSARPARLRTKERGDGRPGLRTCALAGCGAKEAHPSTSRAAPHFQCCSIKSHDSCTAVGPYKGCQVRMHERDWCARARTCVDSRARPPHQR